MSMPPNIITALMPCHVNCEPGTAATKWSGWSGDKNACAFRLMFQVGKKSLFDVKDGFPLSLLTISFKLRVWIILD